MAYTFNDIEVLGTIRGQKYPFKATVEAASVATWGGASGSYSAPTLTISGLSAGSSVGAIDGVTTLALNSRILIKNAGTLFSIASDAWNGIWIVSAIGTTTQAQLVRAFDLLDGDSTANTTVWVKAGTQANTAWTCISNTTVDTALNSITFNQYDVTSTLSIARGGTGLTSTVANRIFATDGAGVASWSNIVPSAVQSSINHGSIGGLSSDDHIQYALLAGRGTGQTLIGGLASGNSLTLQSTANASRGTIILNDPALINDIDTLTATTLQLGKATTNKVEISKSGVVTEVKGTLNIQANIDVAAAGAMNIGTTTATSILIGSTSTTAITAAAKLLVKGASTFGIDTSTGDIMYIGETTATGVYISRTGQTTRVNGPLNVDAVIDRISAGTLSLGTATANAVNIAKTGVATSVLGNLLVEQKIDTTAGVILQIAPTTATSVELGSATINTHVKGNLFVDGTTTSVNSEIVTIADNFLYLNQGFNTVGTETGGLAVNYSPTATTTTATGSGFTSITTVSTVGAATFGVNDIIQISGAVDGSNNGLYVVASHAANVLTLNTTVYGWNQTSFVVSVDTVAVIRKINVSAIRTNTSGDWQVGKGSVAPITFSNLATASTRWSFQPIALSVSAVQTTYTTVAYFPFDFSAYGSATTFTVTLYFVYNNRALSIQIYDGASSIGSATGLATTGIQTFSVTVPGSDKLLEIQILKASAGGSNPVIRALTFDLST
jgi:hypothetical protein